MTVGFHAPLPPARTGVADYASALLRALRKFGDVREGVHSADVHLYHLGNNQLHKKIYEQTICRPGVAVLHDAVLHHFYLGALPEADYLAEYAYNYGPWEQDTAAQLWDERAGSGTDPRYFRRPMLRRVGERSLAVIVHNPAAAEAVLAHAPGALIIEIPHLLEEPAAALDDRSVFRSKQGWGEDAFVFGVFGFLRESKRIMAILQCFEQLAREHARARLLLAGSFASSDLQRAVEPWLAHPAIVRLPHQTDREFAEAMAAVDICLNLRYPAAGETSGIGIRAMGIGKVVFFTDGAEIARFPAGACVRVSPGLSEKAELLEYMRVMVTMPEAVRAIGECAATFIRERHSIGLVAEQYWEALCQAGGSFR